MQRQQHARGERQVLGEHARPGHAADPQPHLQREPPGQRCVAEVEQQLRGQRVAGAAQADEQPHQHVVGEYGRRTPHADRHVLVHQREHFALGPEQSGSEQQHQVARGEDRKPEHETDRRASEQQCAQPRSIARAERLRGESGGPHAQEAESPEQQVEHHGAQRDRAGRFGPRQSTDDRGIDDAHQRHRQVRENHRQRDPQHRCVAVARSVQRAAHGTEGVTRPPSASPSRPLSPHRHDSPTPCPPAA